MMPAISPDMLVWLGLAVLFGLLEIASAGFFFVFFAAGALAVAVLTFFSHSIIIQVILFFAVSLLSVLLARPFLRGALKMGDKPAKESNVAALVGAEVLVTESVGKYHGKVKVIHTGEIWTAFLAGAGDGDTLETGSAGIIVKVDGAKLAVQQKV